MNKTRSSGFTIIEVLIVLAIAGLIITIVFIVVPRARAMSRDQAAKSFVGLLAEQIDQYHSDTGNYPVTLAEKCKFLRDYLPSYIDPTDACFMSPSKDCVYAVGRIYDVCYHDPDSSPHSYLGPVGEVSVQPGHACGPNPASGDPIQTSQGGETNLKHYVVWTQLERMRLVCLST